MTHETGLLCYAWALILCCLCEFRHLW